MVFKSKLLVAIIAIGLIAVAIWGGVTLLSPSDSDDLAPTVTLTTPLDNATNVAINTKVTATFSEEMNKDSISTSTFFLKQGETPISATVSYTGLTAILDPTNDFTISVVYEATITTGVKDSIGNALATEYSWTFTTGMASDITAPTVASTTPNHEATDVSINRPVSVVFSEAMDPLSVNTSTFILKYGETSVSGEVILIGTTATFTPENNLPTHTVFSVNITNEAEDLAGNALAANYIWNFTTGENVVAGPAPVVLGTAGNYVILAKTGVSTTGTTAIVGDLGLSPAAQSYFTGFSETLDISNTFATSDVVTGKMHASNMATPTPAILTRAIGDMEIAYIDATGRAADITELGAGDIGGMNLIPGIYSWGTDLNIPTDVTLNGNKGDVWIFQISGDLIVANSVKVILEGGAEAKDIFWQVAGKATLGTTSDFKGTILCSTNIVLNTGAMFNGRALAQTAVTLDANAVTQPNAP